MATQYGAYASIKIEDNPPGFVNDVNAALNTIAGGATGQRMLNDLNTLAAPFAAWSNSRVIIRRPFKSVMKRKWPWQEKQSVRVVMPGEDGGNRAVPLHTVNNGNGVGTATCVYFNPACLVVPGQGARPTYIALAHELVHAWHNIRGIAKSSYDDEEQFTVGIGGYALPDPNSITENKFRLEFDLPFRHRY